MSPEGTAAYGGLTGHWLTHPAVDAAELRLAPGLAALGATRRFPCRSSGVF
jgi:hypothetical protein